MNAQHLERNCTTITAAKEPKRETPEDYASRGNDEPQRAYIFPFVGIPYTMGWKRPREERAFLCPVCWAERMAPSFCRLPDVTIVFSEGNDENRDGGNSRFRNDDEHAGQRCAGIRKRRAASDGFFVLRFRRKRWQDHCRRNLWNRRPAQEHQGSHVPGIRIAGGAGHLSDQAERRQTSGASARGRNRSIPDSQGQASASSPRSRR